MDASATIVSSTNEYRKHNCRIVTTCGSNSGPSCFQEDSSHDNKCNYGLLEITNDLIICYGEIIIMGLMGWLVFL